MTQSEQERPWIPPAGHDMVLINPEGTRHLSFDMKQGSWFRLLENDHPYPLSVDEAIRLRPSDVDTIIRWTMVYCLQHGIKSKQVTTLIDDLAYGMKVTLSYLIQRAGLH